MLLNLRRIPEGRSVLSQSVKIEDDQAQWLALEGDVDCRAEIDRIQSQIAVHLFYKATAALECSRCLKRFNFPVEGDFHVLLRNKSAAINRGLPADDDEYYFDDATEEIDIRNALFDDIVTALPMKPLCSADCTGLSGVEEEKIAPEGPQDRNRIDPRWEALKKLKDGK